MYKKLIALSLFAVTGLSAQVVRAPGATPSVPQPTGDGPFKKIPNSGAVGRSGGGLPQAQSARRVCRGNAPGGWAAIDYVTDTIACPTKHGKSAEYGTAILVSLSQIPVGDEIEMCGDQGIPRNFARLGDVEAQGRCASALEKDRPRVVRIRRVR